MAQTIHHNLAHIIFSTKDRYPFIQNSIETELYQYLGGTIRSLDGETKAIGGMPDHIHLLVKTSKTISDSEFIKKLKAGSSKWMKDQSIEKFAWQGGYAWFSVSQSNIVSVKAYIANQKEHHRTKSFREEVLDFAEKHGIDFEEQYL